MVLGNVILNINSLRSQEFLQSVLPLLLFFCRGGTSDGLYCTAPQLRASCASSTSTATNTRRLASESAPFLCASAATYHLPPALRYIRTCSSSPATWVSDRVTSTACRAERTSYSENQRTVIPLTSVSLFLIPDYRPPCVRCGHTHRDGGVDVCHT